MKNPSIETLQNSDEFELEAELDHGQIKDFVLEQLTSPGKIIGGFMVYQVAMVVTGIFFLTRSLVLAFRGEEIYLLISVAALFFSFTLLIVIHELFHGVALKWTGAPVVKYGGYLKKFIFYAEADRHVLNRKQFTLVALAPLVCVKVITLAGMLFFWNDPLVCFFILVMSTHSLFCAGDIGLLSFFFNREEGEVYTFDVREEKKSYYYRRRRE